MYIDNISTHRCVRVFASCALSSTQWLCICYLFQFDSHVYWILMSFFNLWFEHFLYVDWLLGFLRWNSSICAFCPVFPVRFFFFKRLCPLLSYFNWTYKEDTRILLYHCHKYIIFIFHYFLSRGLKWFSWNFSYINFSWKVINGRIVEKIGLAYKNLKCGEAEFKVHPGRE